MDHGFMNWDENDQNMPGLSIYFILKMPIYNKFELSILYEDWTKIELCFVVQKFKFPRF